MITTVVADDDARVRQDFARLLELEPDLAVVGVAADGAEAVDRVQRLRPDVVVMDVRMPGIDGIAATARIRATTATRVLVMTTFDLDEYVLGAVRAGASGFLLKDDAVDRLPDAVRTVASGDGIVSPRATARLLAELAARDAREPVGGRAGSAALSAREREIVELLARGLTNEEIAAVTFISRATAKTHVSNILTKLGMTSRLQVALWAHEHGLSGRTG